MSSLIDQLKAENNFTDYAVYNAIQKHQRVSWGTVASFQSPDLPRWLIIWGDTHIERWDIHFDGTFGLQFSPEIGRTNIFGEVETAESLIQSLKKVEHSPDYKPHMPYYAAVWSEFGPARPMMPRLWVWRSNPYAE